MTDTTAPRTAAGRDLVDEWYPGDGDGLDSIGVADFRAAVAAIEREAIEPLLALVRAAQGMASRASLVVVTDWNSEQAAWIALREALAALDPAIVAAARKPE